MKTNIIKYTESVEGEAISYQNMMTNMNKCFKDLESGDLFRQLQKFTDEVRRLSKLCESYEIKHVLLSIELLRRGNELADQKAEVDRLVNLQKEKDRRNHMDMVKIKEEVAKNAKLGYSIEIDKLKANHASEIKKMEAKEQERVSELRRVQQDNENLKSGMARYAESLAAMRVQYDELRSKSDNSERNFENMLQKIKADHQLRLSAVENDVRSNYGKEMKNLQEQLTKERDFRLDEMNNHFTRQINDRDNELSGVRNQLSDAQSKVHELESESRHIRSALQTRVGEIDGLQKQIRTINDENASVIEEMKSTHRRQIREISEELNLKLASDKEEADSAIQERDSEIENLKSCLNNIETKHSHLETVFNKLSQELKREKEINENLRKEIHQKEETYTETLRCETQKYQYDLEDKISNKLEVIEVLQQQLANEKRRNESVEANNYTLQKEINDLKKLGEERRKEIEEWRSNFAGYVPGAEVDQIKNELRKIRSEKLDLEDETHRNYNEIATLKEKVQQAENEALRFNDQTKHIEKICQARKEELIEAREENEQLKKKIREGMVLNQDEESQRQLFKDDLAMKEREIHLLTSNNSNLESQVEKLETQLAEVRAAFTKKCEEHEERLRKLKVPSAVMTTVKTSQVITRGVSENSTPPTN